MSRAPKRIRSFQPLGCRSIQPATSTYFRVGKMSMIWWFGHIGDRRGVVGMDLVTVFHEGGFVEPDSRGAVQPLAIGGEEGLAIGDDGIRCFFQASDIGCHRQEGPRSGRLGAL